MIPRYLVGKSTHISIQINICENDFMSTKDKYKSILKNYVANLTNALQW